MSNGKNSTLELVGIPNEFGVVLLSFGLILTLIPYCGGTDWGIFKVPSMSTNAITILKFLGPALLSFIILLFIPLWHTCNVSSNQVTNAVDSDSKYRLQSIADIVKTETAEYGFHIDGINIGDRLHITDLERICVKTWFSEVAPEVVSNVLQAARAKAFSRKYAEPTEDEKLIDISKIKIDEIKPWITYFYEMMNDQGIYDYNQLDILDVGIGNGYAEEPFLSQIHSFKAVDISEEALQYARRKYPQMICYVCSAEDLKTISNNSVDFYLSLRTFQSTLFDRRAALHESYRVLRNGGIIVISVPILFLKKNGEALFGLIPPGCSEPNMEYAQKLITRIKDYLTILNFSNILVDSRSPFEIYILARR